MKYLFEGETGQLNSSMKQKSHASEFIQTMDYILDYSIFNADSSIYPVANITERDWQKSLIRREIRNLLRNGPSDTRNIRKATELFSDKVKTFSSKIFRKRQYVCDCYRKLQFIIMI